jgi:hypothetical protein
LSKEDKVLQKTNAILPKKSKICHELTTSSNIGLQKIQKIA